MDAKTLDFLCRELKAIQQELKVTTLHISHNSRETSIVADRVGELAGGKLTYGEVLSHASA